MISQSSVGRLVRWHRPINEHAAYRHFLRCRACITCGNDDPGTLQLLQNSHGSSFWAECKDNLCVCRKYVRQLAPGYDVHYSSDLRFVRIEPKSPGVGATASNGDFGIGRWFVVLELGCYRDCNSSSPHGVNNMLYAPKLVPPRGRTACDVKKHGPRYLRDIPSYVWQGNGLLSLKDMVKILVSAHRTFERSKNVLLFDCTAARCEQLPQNVRSLIRAHVGKYSYPSCLNPRYDCSPIRSKPPRPRACGS